jgi:hypothetical protein
LQEKEETYEDFFESLGLISSVSSNKGNTGTNTSLSLILFKSKACPVAIGKRCPVKY